MSSARAAFLIASCLAAAFGPAASPSDPAPGPIAVWLHAGEATRTITIPQNAAPGAPQGVWRGFPWHEVLPGTVLDTPGGGRYDLETTRGQVVLVSFWASWCAPCRVELPHLQELVDGHEGLVGVAVNVEETPEVARAAAEEIGIRMPVGLLDDALRSKIRLGSLPALLLVDREGRIRYRWDGYETGQERAVANIALGLLRGEDPLEPRELARVTTDAEAIDVRWAHEVPDTIEGLTVIPAEGERPPRVVVHSGSKLRAFRADGKPSGVAAAPAGMGILRVGDITGDDRVDLVGFRVGSPRIVGLDLATREKQVAELDTPAFDVAVSETSAASGAPILAVTREGLTFVTGQGRVVGVLAPGAKSVAIDGSRAWMLGIDGQVRTIDLGSGRIEPLGTASPEAVAVVPVPARPGYGLVHRDVRAIAPGRFRSPDVLDWAYATRDGRLVVAREGAVPPVVVAEWPGITQLVAHDLDGDGRDELVVGAGAIVAVLGAVPDNR